MFLFLRSILYLIGTYVSEFLLFLSFVFMFLFFFKQKTAYEMRISDWSSDVCSSDLSICVRAQAARGGEEQPVDRRTAPGEPARAAEIGRASCRERVCQYV